MLKIKSERARGKKKAGARVVYRDENGHFTKRSGREKQSVQVIGGGVTGRASAVKRRTKGEALEAASKMMPSKNSFVSTTSSGTMADRILEAKDENGRALAFEFSKGARSGIVIVSAGELSFTYPFTKEDLQQVLAGALTAYFQRAHAVRERVSAKARAGKGNHRKYSLHRKVRVVVKL